MIEIEDIDSYGIHSDDYKVFLEKRSKSIYDALRKRIELKNERNTHDAELKELIHIGENETMEFKSTLRYDLRENKINKKLIK